MPEPAKFPKPDERQSERVDALVAAHGASRKQMFGTHSWFLDANSQMFLCLWGDEVVARVGQGEAARLVSSGETQQFEPMAGRPMREYVHVPVEEAADDESLAAWISSAAEYAAGLPPKKSKKK
ncbi:MAG: TfoX/Sxy family protein [Dehalococcoidia bacterium]